MSTHKHIDKICCAVFASTLLITVLFMNAESLGVQKVSAMTEYESRLFDTSYVHTIDIVMDDWDSFLGTCKNEEYSDCTVVIDGEVYKNVAIRAKGNTSLTQVEAYGNNRYSFKIEFDHYDGSNTYHGLDKLCLNNMIQDNTYMKDYLTYQMMAEMGVASPLCSYVNISVNNEAWGLYLAVEGVEESFLRRNYGNDYGELYKPDSMDMGGGRGNGKDFEMDGWEGFEGDSKNIKAEDSGNETSEAGNTETQKSEKPEQGGGPMPEGAMQDGSQISDGEMQGGGPMPEGAMAGDGQMPGREMQDDNMNMPPGFPESGIPEGIPGGMPQNIQPPSGGGPGDNGGPGQIAMGSDDVLLKYIDDEFGSYTNIFENAKTDISDSDKERLIDSLKKLSGSEVLEDTVDIEAVIRYFVVHNFVLNFDSYTGGMIHNYYLYEENGQMAMIPWDYNLAFGGFESAGGAKSLANFPIDSPVSVGSAEDRPMIAWIFANEEYTELYHQYFTKFISDYFDSGKFAEMIDSVKTMISPYVEDDPTKFCTTDKFETGIDTLKEFCLLRAESIRGQLNGSIGSTSGTQDESTFVDTGDIEISDMGTMDNSMGGAMETFKRNETGMPQMPPDGSNMQRPQEAGKE